MNSTGDWTDRRDELLARVVRRGRARKLRRRLAGTASVVMIAAVVVFGVVNAGSTSPRSVEVRKPDESTTTVRHATPPVGVLLIGDSVMLGARDALERAITGAGVDARVSRQFWDAIGFLKAVRHAGTLPRTIVVHLGTNGAFSVAQFVELMQTAGPDAQVYFLTTHMPRPWEQAVNRSLVADVSQWPNAHVLDWHGFADGKPWFVADGIHLNREGATQYARFIRDGIGAAAPGGGINTTDRFVGHWHVHDAFLTIESNSNGFATFFLGPPNVETDDLSLSLSPTRKRMTATITKIT